MNIPLTESALARPWMGGAGWVRDLGEAMSLSETQAPHTSQLPESLQGLLGEAPRPLIHVVSAFAAAPTKAAQMDRLDELIRAWAATNEYLPLIKPLNDPARRFVATNDSAWHLLAGARC